MINGLNYKNNNAAAKSASSKISNIGNCGGVGFYAEENDAKRVKSSSAESSAPTRRNISSNRILGALSDYDAARLMPHLDFVSLTHGAEIHRAGEPNRYVYFPETVVVSYVYDLADGSTIETAMIGSEGATGLCSVLAAHQPPAHRARATVGGSAWRIKAETLKQELARGGKIQTMLFAFMNEHVNQISQRLVCKSFHVVEKRLCSWLLMLHDRVKDNRLTLTQENAALLLGANRPTITIAAQNLRNKRLIDYSRGKFHLLDRRGLENSACECYAVLQTNLSPDFF